MVLCGLYVGFEWALRVLCGLDLGFIRVLYGFRGLL